MAISRVSAQDARNTGTNGLTVNYPGTPTQNNLLLAAVATTGTTTSPTISSSGWTLVQRSESGNNLVALYGKLAGSSEAMAVTVAASGSSFVELLLTEYTGNVTSSFANCLDVYDQNNSAAGGVTSLAMASLTTTQASELVYYVAGTPGGNNSVFGFTNATVVFSSGARITTGQRIVSSTGTYTDTASWNTSRPGRSVAASFKAATATAVNSGFFWW